jgi:hypothetical protein
MKQAWMGLVLLAIACGVKAQDQSTLGSATNVPANSNSAETLAPPESWTNDSGNFALTSSTGPANAPAASPTPADPADPKYVFWGDRDDYRWQLGVGLEYLRFQSSAFNANLVGLNTSVAYYTSDWFGLEGDLVTGFGSDVYPNSRAKVFGGLGGVRIGGRRARWEPWAHVLAGGGHLQPQTAYGSRTGLMVQAGGGVDYRIHARLSLRGEGDWVHTTFFGQGQNSLQIVGGIVLHF